MDGSDSNAAGETANTSQDATAEAGGEAQSEVNRAAEGLRGQIAALRQQVRDAQDTLRDHQQRQETRALRR